MNVSLQFIDFLNPQAAPDHLDALRAQVPVTAPYVIDGHWVMDIEGLATVYRDGDRIELDDLAVVTRKDGKDDVLPVWVRRPNESENAKTVIASMLYDQCQTEAFERDADEALAKLEMEEAYE